MPNDWESLHHQKLAQKLARQCRDAVANFLGPVGSECNRLVDDSRRHEFHGQDESLAYEQGGTMIVEVSSMH